MKHSTAGRKTPYGKAKHGTGFDPEAGFEFGYFYRSIEDHVNAFAAAAGGENSFSNIASRVARLLDAASIRERGGNPELLPEVRQDFPANRNGRPPQPGYDSLSASQALHVHARDREPLKRYMTKAARMRIARAQRKRWKRYKLEQRGGRGIGRGHGVSPKVRAAALKGYWASMTPEERSAEMTRRRQVAAQKKKG